MDHPFGSAARGGYNLAGGVPMNQWSAVSGMPGGFVGDLLFGGAANTFQDPAHVQLGFSSTQNIYDQMKLKAMTDRNMQVLQASAYSDKKSIENFMLGTAAAMHLPLTEQRRNDISDMAQKAVNASPYLAQMFPDMFDQLHGARGSAAVMATQLMHAGRYQIDPVTGRVGMSGESIAAMAQGLKANLFDDDKYLGMRGLRMGETGRLYDEMTRRGMMGQPLSPMMNARGALSYMAADPVHSVTLQTAMAAQGLAAGTDPRTLSDRQVQALSQDKAVGDVVGDANVQRAANIKQVGDKLKDWSGTIAAMKEIFGDAGHPNASIPEIMNALEQMTNGTMAQFTPGRVEGMVRKMRNLANSSGIGMEGAMHLMNLTSAQASRMGLHGSFAPEIAMSSMAFRSSLDMSHPGWGRSSADVLMAQDAQLRTQAAGSQMANQLGMLARLGEQGLGNFKAGSDQAALLQAVQRRDQGTITRLIQKHGLQNEQAFISFLSKGSGGTLSNNTLAGLLSDQFGNQEYIMKNRLQDTVRSAQGALEIDPLMARHIGGRLQGSYDPATAQQMGKIAWEALRSADPSERDKDTIMSIRIGQALAKAQGKDWTKMSEEERQAFKRQGLESLAGSEYLARRMGTTRADILASQDRAALAQGELRQRSAEDEALIQASVGGVGKGTMIEKLVQGMMDLGDKPDDAAISKMIAGVVGGAQDPAKIAPMMQALKAWRDKASAIERDPEFVAYQAEMRRVDDALAVANKGTDENEIRKWEKKKADLEASRGSMLNKEKKHLEGAVDQVMKTAEQAGLDLSEDSGPTKAAPAGGVPIVKAEFPKDGFRLVAGELTIKDERKLELSGNVVPAGAAPQQSQA